MNFIFYQLKKLKKHDAKRGDFLARNASGDINFKAWTDKPGHPSAFYDVFQEDARTFMFDKVIKGIIEPFGITMFWLDCDEPCNHR